MNIQQGMSLRGALNDVTEGLYVWVKVVNHPEILIPKIDQKKIESFFKENAWLENSVVMRSEFVDSGDFVIFIER